MKKRIQLKHCWALYAYRDLVEVAEAHPLYSSCLPLRQRGNKLHGGRLLLQHAERQGAQHSVTLVYEGLGRGASVDGDHLAAWRMYA